MEDFAPSCAQFIQNLGSFVLHIGMVENCCLLRVFFAFKNYVYSIHFFYDNYYHRGSAVNTLASQKKCVNSAYSSGRLDRLETQKMPIGVTV